jgi:hypothetical protein
MIDEYDNTIYSRDVIDRITELEDTAGLTDDEIAELKDLSSFAEEAESYNSCWNDGTILISDSYFESYIQEQCEEVYAQIDFSAFPFYLIDWTAAAEEAMDDYSEVILGSTTFWIGND